jgi:hypothetical protein
MRGDSLTKSLDVDSGRGGVLENPGASPRYLFTHFP